MQQPILRYPVAALTLAAALLCAAPAGAVEPAALLDRQLDRQPIRFVSLSGGELSFFDADRRLRRVSAADYVSLRMTDDSVTSESQSKAGTGAVADSGGEGDDDGDPLLKLADGHILRGHFAGVDDQGRLLWDTNQLGQRRFTLDDVVRFTLANPEPTAPDSPTAPAPPVPPIPPDQTVTEDRIVLRNGDAITGFIEALTPQGPVAQVAGQSVPLAWETVARITLANPARHEPGVWVRLTDGSRINVQEAAFDGESLTGRVFEGQRMELIGSVVEAIDFTQLHRLIPLGDLEPSIISGGQVFGVPMNPRFAGDTAHLHAPLELRFDLPEGSLRFAADASLEPGDLAWADLELIVADADGELFTQRLNVDQPQAAVNVPLRDRTLIIRLHEGVNGPIRDRLTLNRAVLLVENQP